MSFCIVLLKRIEKHSAPEFMYRVCVSSIYYLLEFGKIFGFSIDMICNLQIFKLSMFYFEQYFGFVQFQWFALSLHFPLASFRSASRFHNINSKILCVRVCARWCIDACIWHSCIFDKTMNEDTLSGPTWFSTHTHTHDSACCTTTKWYVSDVYDGIAKETRKRSLTAKR